MSVLTRDDNIQFVVQPYRELLSFRQANLLKKEIRFLAQQNGQFVRLFKQNDGRYEAVFSRDPGVLLAETIWDYFDNPDDLIYCEALPDKKHAIVVIVRSGSILYDAKLSIETLAEELAALLTLKNKFNIYIYGNIPLSPDHEEDKIVFDADHVLSFKRLEEPLFPQLSVNPSLQLLPVEQSINEHRLGQPSFVTLFALIVVIVVIGIGVWSYLQPAQVQQEIAENPYHSFEQALSTPSPSNQIDNLAKDAVILYGMPGWVPAQLNYNQTGAKTLVHSIGGNVMMLMDWAKQHDAHVILNTNGAEVVIPSELSRRTKPKTILNREKISALIIDDMMKILPGHSVTITQIQSFGVYSTTNMTITYNNIAPGVLELIGRTLWGLPVKLNHITTKFNAGMMSGSINLTVLGN